jgi:uncharacterized membrane protein
MFPQPPFSHPIVYHVLVRGGIIGPLFWLGVAIVGVLIIVALVDLVIRRSHQKAASVTPLAAPTAPFDPAESILRERLARGEIDVTSFEAARSALGLK